MPARFLTPLSNLRAGGRESQGGRPGLTPGCRGETKRANGGVSGGVFTGMPYVGFGASEGWRDYHFGLRLARMNRDAFALEFGVEATREESAGAYDPIHGMTFRLVLRR